LQLITAVFIIECVASFFTDSCTLFLQYGPV